MIMNSKKKREVFGVTELQQVNDDYQGQKTDTADVTVNNVDRTISVDVNFEGMLGEDNNKAYPGHLGAQTRRLLMKLEDKVSSSSEKFEETDTELKRLIERESFESDYADSKLRQELANVTTQLETSYATKTYVYEQLASFAKLSKQIADSIDVDNDTVTIDGVVLKPLDGVVYLVKDENNLLEDSYKQYTLIDGELVLIGTTNIDLSDYAKVAFVEEEIDKTKKFVNEQIDAIPEVDLTDYAKKSDIPDVSSFIAEIPSEYITEEEIAPYATKVYVQTELSKVGKLSKQIVDDIDLENNTITIDGVISDALPDVVYLVSKADSEGAYSQYTLIDNTLTWIGDTDVDLKGYATQEYVDTSVAAVESNIIQLLNTIEFIDGGKAPLI